MLDRQQEVVVGRMSPLAPQSALCHPPRARVVRSAQKASVSRHLRRPDRAPGTAALALVLLATLCSAHVHGQGVLEGFDTVVPVADGTQLGSCKQLVARLAAGGAIEIANSQASLTSPTPQSGALLASSNPMPSSDFEARVVAHSVAFSNSQDFALLAGFYTKVPKPSAGSYFNGAATIEIGAYPGFGIVISYFDSGGAVHSWKDGAWVSSFFGPSTTFSPTATYTVIVRQVSQSFSIELLVAGQSQIKTASVPLAAVGGSLGYFTVGEVLTDASQGSLELNRIVLPKPASCGGTAPADAGASPADAGPDPADGPVTDAGPLSSSDLSSSDLTPTTASLDLSTSGSTQPFDLGFLPLAPPSAAGQGCDIGAADDGGDPRSVLLLIALVLAAIAGARYRAAAGR